jgi:hypothetical protein
MRAELMEEMESKYKTGPSSLTTLWTSLEFLEKVLLTIGLGEAKRIKSSHELVELAYDNKTPLWIRDGGLCTYMFNGML